MKKIYSLSKIRNIAASIGIFDSVHIGHKKILKKLVKEAKKEKRKSLVITFHPHPRKILNPSTSVPFITSLEHRLMLMKELGVDFFLVVKFTKSLSRMKAEVFIAKFLVEGLDVKTLVVGENFLFGNKKDGNFEMLKKISRIYGFKLFGVKPAKIKGSVVSSTRIRRAIERGDLRTASLMMGRPVTVLGTVVRGRSIGRRLGFPTANINPHHEAILPSGVYAVRVKLHNRFYNGVLNIGRRPTFGGDMDPIIELHILNFKRDIYNKDIEIMFKRKIRSERRFPSVEALRNQIKRDIRQAG